MTRKAAPFARHPLPPQGPCVCLSAVPGSCAGWGAGWPAVQGTQDLPLLLVGGSSWGFSALGEVCSCSVGARAGRKHGSSGGGKPSSTWAHFTLSPVTSHLQPHPSRVSDMHPGASNLLIHPCLALPWRCQQPGHLAPKGRLAMRRRPRVQARLVSANFSPSSPSGSEVLLASTSQDRASGPSSRCDSRCIPGLSKLQNRLFLVKQGGLSAGCGVSMFGCREVMRR